MESRCLGRASSILSCACEEVEKAAGAFEELLLVCRERESYPAFSGRAECGSGCDGDAAFGEQVAGELAR
jgi:hypothetical protein